MPPASDAASTGDGAWEIAYQSLQDENEELKNRCSELEESLSQTQFLLSHTQKESAIQVQKANNTINASNSQVEELREALRVSEDKFTRLSRKQDGLRQRATEQGKRAMNCKKRWKYCRVDSPGLRPRHHPADEPGLRSTVMPMHQTKTTRRPHVIPNRHSVARGR